MAETRTEYVVQKYFAGSQSGWCDYAKFSTKARILESLKRNRQMGSKRLRAVVRKITEEVLDS